MRLGARVLRWYARRGRELPWRKTRDPYAILVSELMLQQTQVSRVVPKYALFLERFPTLRALAAATLGDVLRAWSGLGYNRRARDLHRIARTCARGLPRGRAELDALPGIGRYTAGAIACFAHGDAIPFADTNIRRVLGRALLGRTASEREAEALDARQLPRGRAAEWHHALMDLGATVCTGRAPRCGECPLRAICRSRGEPERRPSRAPARAFARSARWVRGRIVAVLARASSGITAAVLRREVGDRRAPALARRLVQEGLVEVAGGAFRLPG